MNFVTFQIQNVIKYFGDDDVEWTFRLLGTVSGGEDAAEDDVSAGFFIQYRFHRIYSEISPLTAAGGTLVVPGVDIEYFRHNFRLEEIRIKNSGGPEMGPGPVKLQATVYGLQFPGVVGEVAIPFQTKIPPPSEQVTVRDEWKKCGTVHYKHTATYRNNVWDSGTTFDLLTKTKSLPAGAYSCPKPGCLSSCPT